MAGRVVLKEDNSPSRRIARAGGKVKDAKVEGLVAKQRESSPEMNKKRKDGQRGVDE